MSAIDLKEFNWGFASKKHRRIKSVIPTILGTIYNDVKKDKNIQKVTD